MIAIIDYGVGNINAFANIYRSLDIEFSIAREPSDIRKASKLILPGVGSFDWAMNKLSKSNLIEDLSCVVLDKSVPILGVCVGMQIMANSSDEGILNGLGWLDGSVKHLSNLRGNKKFPLPHMGWNNVAFNEKSPLSNNISISDFYFLHSYYFESSCEDISTGFCDYGERFTCAIQKDNIFATQFHPEKSHQAGVKLLKNFHKLT